MFYRTATWCFILTWLLPWRVVPAQTEEQSQAQAALRKVVDFYRHQVGFQGAYLWRYSADLDHQEGEEIATRTSGWTQPPGTPAVGEAYLKAWLQSGEPACRVAAVEAAHALVQSQLKSGGWSSHFELEPAGREAYAYVVDGESAGRNNLTTFDDNKSQSALMLLMHMDEALKFTDADIHAAVVYALSRMLAAQYPNGAWPQQYVEPPNARDFTVMPAAYPATWSRQFPGKRYRDYYTLNDSNMSYIVEMLLEAHRIYDREDCYQAALRTGDFFVLAQMPEPQPGWAQQYDADMQPAWARKFEPPAITGGESQGVMQSLLRLYEWTGEKRFLAPLPRALEYFKQSKLRDGRLARFYELQTNRPLYFTKDYQLTYSDADVPTHYAFKVNSKLESLEKQYQRLRDEPLSELKPVRLAFARAQRTSNRKEQAQRVMAELDPRGGWVEVGKMQHTPEELPILDMRTLIRNLDILSAYAGAES